jgi:hypothetical protein
VSYLFRSLGSVVGLSLGSTLLQGTLRRQLRAHLIGTDIEEVRPPRYTSLRSRTLTNYKTQLVRRVRESLTYVDSLEPATRVVVRAAYERAVSTTFAFTVASSLCALIAAACIREKALPGR